MTKLILQQPKENEVLVRKVNAGCDWCGTSGKDCIRSPRVETVKTVKTENKRVLNARPIYSPSMFDGGNQYRIGFDDWGYGEVVSRTEYEKIDDFDICKECAKQVVDLLK